MTVTSDLEDRYKNDLTAVDIEQFKIYGQRYLDYRSNYKLANNHQITLDFPIYLMLEQTYKCNLECPSCIQGHSSFKSEFSTNTNVMDRSLFDQVVLEGEENGCPSISFHVNDEPLLVKDLPERISFAKKHGFMDLIMTTNGMLLTQDTMKKVVDAGITHILFSVDAATSVTYDIVRPGGDFTAVVNNIQTLLNYKKNNNLTLPATRASFVSSKLNVHEKDLFIEKFEKLVDFIEVQTLSTYYDMNSNLSVPNAIRVDNLRCSEPWVRLIVRANGDVLPCCSFYGYEIVLGNINELSLKEIYKGKQCQTLKREIKEGKYTLAPCQACSTSLYKL